MTLRIRTIFCFLAAALSGWSHLAQADAPTYDDQVLGVFTENCAACHNADKHKADLDLTSYGTLMAGSSSGKIVAAGKADESTLFRVLMHQQEPYMPPNKPRLPDAQIDLIKRWIDAGLKENAGSKAVAAQPRVSLALAPSAMGKPKGAPPMPGPLPLDPVVHSQRLNCPVALAHSPWAPLVAIGGQHQVLLYNSATRELLGVLPFPEGFPDAMTFSHSGTVLLVAGGRGAALGRAVLYDVATGRRLAVLGKEYDSILAADISPDQTSVAIGGPGKLVKVLATDTGKQRYAIKKHTDWVLSLAFSPDGVLLASGDRNGGLYVWEARTGENFYELRGHTAGVTALAWRPDSNLLASGSEDGTVRLWDMSNGTQAKSWQAHAGGVEDVRYSADGRLVTAGRDHAVKVWDGEGRLIRAYEGLPDLATRATFNQDGKTVIGGDWTGRIYQWSVDAEKPLGQFDPNPPTLAMRIAAVEQKIAAARKQVTDIAPDDVAAAALRHDAEKSALDLALAQARLHQLDSPATTRATAAPSAATQPLAAATLPAGSAADRQALVESIANLTTLSHSRAGKLARYEQAQHTLAALAQEAGRWHKAQLFQALYAAQGRLADRQAQAAQCQQALAAAQATVKQARAEAAAAAQPATRPADEAKLRLRSAAAATALAQAQGDLAQAQSAAQAATAQLAQAQDAADDAAALWKGEKPRVRVAAAGGAGGAAGATSAAHRHHGRAAAWVERHTLPVAIVSCLLITLCGLGDWLWSARRQRRKLPPAWRPRAAHPQPSRTPGLPSQAEGG